MSHKILSSDTMINQKKVKAIWPFFIVFFFCVFTGCAHRSESINNDRHYNRSKDLSDLTKNNVDDATLLEQAFVLLDDISIPVGFVIDSVDETMQALSYSGTQTITDVIAYMNQHLERLGWDIEMFSMLDETVVIAHKPFKSCAIVCRTLDQKTIISICIHNQELTYMDAMLDVNSKMIPDIIEG